MVTRLAIEHYRAALAEPVCRHGHGPLDGWRQRGRTRGRYCRACNVEANRRCRERHARGLGTPPTLR